MIWVLLATAVIVNGLVALVIYKGLKRRAELEREFDQNEAEIEAMKEDLLDRHV